MIVEDRLQLDPSDTLTLSNRGSLGWGSRDLRYRLAHPTASIAARPVSKTPLRAGIWICMAITVSKLAILTIHPEQLPL
jgi:hypothetical protein